MVLSPLLWHLPCLFAVSFLSAFELIVGNYIFPELTWTQEACKDQGFLSNEFELCSTLEFCEGSGKIGTQSSYHMDMDHDRDRRFVRRRLSKNNPEDYYAKEANIQKAIHNAPSEARFGWRIPGTTECVSPGPIIRISRGRSYGLFVRNSAMNDTTNLHLHGLHIAGSGNADDVTRYARPGDSILYNITIPEDHMGGTFLYHSHYHDHVQEQVSGGAFGMIILDDGDDIGTDNPNILDFLRNEKVMIIDNLRDSTHLTVNGIQNETFHLNKDEWYRVRILHVNALSEGTQIEFGDECDVNPIANDGIFLFSVPGDKSNKLFLSSSSRVDIALRCRDSSKIKALGSTIALIEMNQNAIDPKTNATVFENGSQKWLSKRPAYLQDLSKETVDQNWTINIYKGSLNGQPCDMKRPLCHNENKDFSYATINEWDLNVADDSGRHPLHVHIFPMQVVDGCGEEHKLGEFYDTILVSPDVPCKVRLRFVDLSGPVVMHCHILEHEEMGAMGFINVIGGPLQPIEPRVLHCSDAADGSCDEPKSRQYCNNVR